MPRDCVNFDSSSCSGSRDAGHVVLACVEFTCCAFFLLDILITCFYYPSALDYLTSAHGVVDVVSVVPIIEIMPLNHTAINAVLIALAAGTLITAAGGAFVKKQAPPWNHVCGLFALMGIFALAGATQGLISLQFLSVLRIFKASRIIRLTRAYGKPGTKDGGDELNFEIVVLGLKLVAIVFLATGLVLEASVLDPSSFVKAMQWHDAFYYVVVTMSTVGYGDYYPTAAATKMGVVVFIMVCFMYIPEELVHINELSRNRKRHRRLFAPGRQVTGHVLLCGHPTVHTVQRFLEEFYHPDRSYENGFRQVVLLIPGDNPEMARLAKHPEFGSSVWYIQGCPSRNSDLQITRAHKADVIFLLGDFNADQEMEDKYVLISALSITKFNARHPEVSSPRDIPPMVAKTTTAVGADALQRIGVAMPLSSERLKATMLCFGSHNPGWIPFVVHLMRSNSCGGIPQRTGKANWLSEHIDGTNCRLYKITIARLDHLHRQMYTDLFGKPHPKTACCLDGISWLELSLEIIPRACVLIGVLMDNEDVRINPGSLFHLNRHVKAIFVLARDEDSAMLALCACLGSSHSLARQLPEMDVELEDGPGHHVRDSEHAQVEDAVDGTLRSAPAAGKHTVLLLPEHIDVAPVALFVARWFTMNAAGSALVAVHPQQEYFAALKTAVQNIHSRQRLFPGDVQHRSLEHIQGISSDIAVLENAGVREATAVICFSHQGRKKATTMEHDSAVFDDQDVILTALALDDCLRNISGRESVHSSRLHPPKTAAYGPPTRAFDDIFTLYDIKNQDSVSLLRQNTDTAKWRFTENLAHTATSTSFKSLFTWPAFASGRVYAQSIVDALLVPLSSASEAALWAAFFDACADGFANMSVPCRFVRRPYQDICCHYAVSGIVALGLYRPIGTFGATMPYVHTNPCAKTMLVHGDRVFILKARSTQATEGVAVPAPARFCTWF